tara:strand:- start:575 stop:1387 length:813 start_codon:yes stop_codon:yes gene_type:complete
MAIKAWRYLDGEREDGVFNMAADQALLTLCNEGKSPPTIRLYGWRKPTVSIGYSGKGLERVDVGHCRKNSIDIVRRPTGGRILLHAEELTYSVTAPLEHPSFPKGLRKTHNIISQAIAECFGKFGIMGGVRVISKPREGSGGAQLLSPACFGLSNMTEITIDGRKIVGSAQRRLSKAFLQHGSVLIDFDPKKLNEIFIFSDKKARQNHLSSLKKKVTCLSKESVLELNFACLKLLFLEGLKETLAKSLEKGIWTSEEIELREKIMRQIVI